MALNSSDVNAGDDILAVHNNNLIDDIEQHTHEGTDTSLVSFPATTRYLMIAPAPTTHINTSDQAIEGISIELPDTNVIWYEINLPHGAIITRLDLYGYCSQPPGGGSTTLLATLYRTENDANTEVTMASCSIVGTNADFGFKTNNDVTIVSATIDNSGSYSYILKLLCSIVAGGDTSFKAGLITYTITGYGT